jgi:hypothetical protein
MDSGFLRDDFELQERYCRLGRKEVKKFEKIVLRDCAHLAAPEILPPMLGAKETLCRFVSRLDNIASFDRSQVRPY